MKEISKTFRLRRPADIFALLANAHSIPSLRLVDYWTCLDYSVPFVNRVPILHESTLFWTTEIIPFRSEYRVPAFPRLTLDSNDAVDSTAPTRVDAPLHLRVSARAQQVYQRSNQHRSEEQNMGFGFANRETCRK